MSDRTSNLKTGIYFSVGILLTLASILFFGGDRAFLTKYNKYLVHFNSTQGLNPGSPVSLNGLGVGNVSEIQIDPNGKLSVEVKIDSKYYHLITQNTIAGIRTQGALGDRYIYLLNDAPGGRVLSPGESIQIDTQPDLLDVISGKASDFAVLKDILMEFHQLLQSVNNNGNSGKLMQNATDSSAAMKSLLSDPNLKVSFNHLKNILKKIDSGEGTLGKLVNDPTLHDQLVGLVGESPRNSFLKPLLREAIKQNNSN